MICGSTQQISATGYSRFTSADGKLIKLSATVGSTGGSTTHSHTVSGDLDKFIGSAMTSSSGSRCVKAKASGDYSHTHSVSTETGSVSIMPAYIQNRLYQVTAAKANIPVNTVLFVDGSISGYTDYLQILSGWNGYFIMSGDTNPSPGGANSHNHGTGGSVSSSSTTNPAYGTSGTNSAMQAYHTHTINISFDASDVEHIPEFVYLVPVAVIKEINPLSTKTKTYTADLLAKKKNLIKTYAADITISQAGGKYYVADVLIKKRNIARTYIADLLAQFAHSKTYAADSLIKKTDNRNAYRMGIKVWRPLTTYTMNIRIISTAKSVGSIINTLLDSYVDQFNKVLQKIYAASGNMKIEYASGEALENRWGKAYNMPRKPGETDTEYRNRLLSYERAVLGSGTYWSVKSMLDFATKGNSTKLKITPGRVLIYFDSDEQRRNAAAILPSLDDVLYASIAAGVIGQIYINFKDIDMDLLIKKPDAVKQYNMNFAAAARLTAEYGANIMAIKRFSKEYDLSLIVWKTCMKVLPCSVILRKTCTEQYQIDLLAKKLMYVTYQARAAVLKKNIGAQYMEKMVVRKQMARPYNMRMAVSLRFIKFYKMHLVVKAQGSAEYNMSIKIVE